MQAFHQVGRKNVGILTVLPLEYGCLFEKMRQLRRQNPCLILKIVKYRSDLALGRYCGVKSCKRSMTIGTNERQRVSCLRIERKGHLLRL